MNVDQRQGQLNALGTAKQLIPLVKNVAHHIVMKPAVIMELTLAPMAAAAHVNAAHLLRRPALLQAVVLHQVVHLQVVLLQKQDYGLIPVIQKVPVLMIIDTNSVKITAAAFMLIVAVPLYMTHSFYTD